MLRAAADRFRSDGWHRTTVAAIASDAGVSVDLVSLRVGTKVTLLVESLRATAFTQVPDLRQAVEALDLGGPETSVEERVARFSSFAVATLEPIAEFHDVLRQAADAEPPARAMLDEIERTRRDSTQIVLRKILLANPDPQLVDELFVLTSTAVYCELTQRCGWSSAQVQTWLRQVVGEAVTRSRS